MVRRQPALQTAKKQHHDYLEVSLVDELPPAADETQATTVPEAEAPSMPGRVAALDRAAPGAREIVAEPAAPADESEAIPPSVTPPSAGSASADSTGPRALSLDAIGLGGNNAFFGMKGIGDAPAAPAPRPAASGEVPTRTEVAERRLKQYLVVGMLEHDRATGGSRNGAVVTALRDAAMLIDSPVNGQAEFVATVDAAGLVTALRPTRVTSNAASWKNVAARALKELAKKHLRVPAGANGLEVRLALTSKIALPSGSTSVGSIHTVPLLTPDGTRLSRLELPPESNKLPDQGDPGALGTPLVRQPISGSGLDGDLADIGGISRRVVHVSITDERPL
ncbi:MAG TPA: hypothetical protein VH062_27645 [Polyangiaceae bacterium]|nr:hypothetical protein [Polyangiaceae bacterium]